MYSTGRRALRGRAHHDWVRQPRKGPRLVTLAFDARRFERFRKLEPSLTLDFTKRISGAWERELKLGYTAIEEENMIFEEGGYRQTLQATNYEIPWLSLRVQKQNALQGLAAEGNIDLLRARTISSKLTLRYYRYYSTKDRVQARFFAGRIFSDDAGKPGWYGLGLSGSPDYKKESIFLDRSQISNSLAAFRRQTDGGDGGFRNYIPVYASRWLAALNLEADLPLGPLGAYLDLGLAPGLYYGTGFSVSLAKDFIQIYLPLAGSNYAQDIPRDFPQFKDNIRFQIRFQTLNPFRLVSEVLR
jgi:hypothetical protein